MIRYSTLLVTLFFCICLSARERVTDFFSFVRPSADGCIHVIERITFNAEHRDIKRGIYRAIPTGYSWGPFRNNLDFQLHSVLLDGKVAGFRIREIGRGAVLDIGQAEKRFDELISIGLHTVEIEYTLCRVFRFFDDHDELYLNVTGLDWSLPIEQASVIVQMEGTLRGALQDVTAYTGFLGARGKEYAVVRRQSIVEVATTRDLLPGQGLTIALAFKKGAIKEPSQWQNLMLFFKDNHVVSLSLLFLLFLLLLTAYVILRNRKSRFDTPVIARFSPPEGYTPGQLRYLLRQQVDATCVAADIVYAAVRGLLTIKLLKKRMLFNNAWYQLSRVSKGDTKQISEPENPVLRTLLSALFSRGENLTLNREAANIVFKTLQSLQQMYCRLRDLTQQGYGVRWFFKEAAVYLFAPMILCIAWISNPYPQDLWVVLVFVIVIILLGVVCMQHGWTYDVRGRELATHAKGFEWYLKTAEVERLRYTGTPPERTPELYEKFLPYAIALGVEKEWSQQFVPVFERLARQGQAYPMPWLVGRQRGLVNLAYMGQNLSAGLKSTIRTCAAVARRGVFSGGSGTWSGGSGFSGGGFSGGGSGGGGGGGR